MKNKLKYLISVALIAVCLLGLGIQSSAYEGGGEDSIAADTSDTSSNIFSKVYAEVSEYAAEIFSALTLIGSLVLAFAYKKGLLPLISGALSAISKTLSGVKSRAEEGERELDEGLERLTALAIRTSNRASSSKNQVSGGTFRSRGSPNQCRSGRTWRSFRSRSNP